MKRYTKHMPNNPKVNDSQAGFVSIIVTMIIMAILTLIVIGFAQIARREQRAALDRHLSTQAFYAAESGVNDLQASVANSANALYFSSFPSNTNCANTATIPGMQPILNASTGVKYTCVLYDTAPMNVNYAATTDSLTLVPISNTNLTKISINWNGTDNSPTFRSTAPSVLPSTDTWGSSTGMIRLMIIPRSVASWNIYTTFMNAFLYPEQSASAQTAGSASAASTLDYSTASGLGGSGAVVSGKCNSNSTPSGCIVDITNLPTPNTKGYLLVLRGIYTTSNVSISGFNGATPVQLNGAQIVVDATGQAGDVIRRIQVRLPVQLNGSNILPPGFESMDDLCKQIQIQPSVTAQPVLDKNGCSLSP